MDREAIGGFLPWTPRAFVQSAERMCSSDNRTAEQPNPPQVDTAERLS
jgi:hypothetical protein